MKNSTKALAAQIAKQMQEEPLEILKNAREQISGERLSEKNPPPEDQKKQFEEQSHVNDQLKSIRRVEALQREIEDIRKQDLFRDLQKRISAGETISLEEYTELSMEQKQVLKAQMEAVKTQMLNAKYANDKPIPLFGSSKPDRRMGQKNQAKKEQTRVEKPVQNST